MKNKIILICSIVLVVVVLFVVSNNTISNNVVVDNNTEEEINKLDEQVKNILSNMTLEEKIGQMLIVNYAGTIYDESILKSNPGGFIIMNDNIDTYNQLQNLIDTLQDNSKIPLFISIDQEGGRVQRLQSLTDVETLDIPNMSLVGKTNNTSLTYELGTAIGKELNVFGINMDFAPVLDINSNPDNPVIGERSFGDNKTIVSKMGLSLSKGLKEQNIIPVFKHFPGHGDTSVDSHIDLPIVTKSKEELLELELSPFIDAINDNAEVIMIGHLAVPSITGNNTPASLSKEVITDLLKEELNFNGLVITDALNMKAVTNNYSNEEIILMALDAGVDILLMPKDVNNVINIVKNAINENKINENRIKASVSKIIRFKLEYGLFDNKNKLGKDYLNSIAHQIIVNKILEYK